jgi:hypothetical protein
MEHDLTVQCEENVGWYGTNGMLRDRTPLLWKGRALQGPDLEELLLSRRVLDLRPTATGSRLVSHEKSLGGDEEGGRTTGEPKQAKESRWRSGFIGMTSREDWIESWRNDAGGLA